MEIPGLLEKIEWGEKNNFDGFVVACFDTGIDACREIAAGPVVGMSSLLLHMASMIAHNFSIVTTLPDLFVIGSRVKYGMDRYCRKVRSANIEVLVRK